MVKKLLALGLSLVVLNFGSISFADSELNKILAGESIVKEKIDKSNNKGFTQLIFMVKTPPEELWKVLTDYENYPKFMPTVEETKVKSGSKNFTIIYIKLESPPLMEISYDMRRVYNKKDWEITFKKIAGKIKDIEGSWKLEPIDDKRTKVIYTNSIDIGLPVPDFILDSFKKKGLYKMADHIRKRAESGGKWTRN